MRNLPVDLNFRNWKSRLSCLELPVHVRSSILTWDDDACLAMTSRTFASRLRKPAKAPSGFPHLYSVTLRPFKLMQQKTAAQDIKELSCDLEAT